MPKEGLTLRRVSGALGVEIAGIDLSGEIPEDTIAEIRRIWRQHLVVFFRDQPLPPARFLAFAERFGTPMDYPFLKGLEDFPAITPVTKRAHETARSGSKT